MKKLLLITGIFLLANFVFAADDLGKKAEENPLDCALYLLVNDREQIDPLQLATAFFEAGRYDDAIRALDTNGYDFQTASHFTLKLLKNSDKTAADKFLVKGLQIIKEDEQYGSKLKDFIRALVLSGRADAVDDIISKQDDEYPEEKAELLLAYGLTLLDIGQVEKANAVLDEAFTLDGSTDEYYLVPIANTYLKLGKPEKASEIIKRIAERAASATDENVAHDAYMTLVPLYFETGNAEKGLTVWQQHRDASDPHDDVTIAEAYIKSGDMEAAKPYLLGLESRDERISRKLVETYLQQNDIDNALRIAKMMSTKEDSYQQQSSLMQTADKYIETGRTDPALDVINYAFARATKVGETHRDQDSHGASPLTRKISYLGEIRDRYLKLKRYDKISGLLKAFKTDRNFIEEFKAETYVSLAKAQVKTLSVKKLIELLAKAQNAFTSDSEYERAKIEIDVADVYAKSGDKANALELLTATLKKTDGEYYLDDLLIYSGKIFEENKLKSTPELKKVLREIIGEDETDTKK